MSKCYYYLYVGFQFLMGTLKTVVSGVDIWVFRRFQFLIGTLKTGKSSLSQAVELFQFLMVRWKQALPAGSNDMARVSIPHRYAENVCACQRMRLHNGFQFLIGTLKTKSTLSIGAELLTFQFLIGTLKTFCLLFLCVRMPRFQFLIGTLKTISGKIL